MSAVLQPPRNLELTSVMAYSVVFTWMLSNETATLTDNIIVQWIQHPHNFTNLTNEARLFDDRLDLNFLLIDSFMTNRSVIIFDLEHDGSDELAHPINISISISSLPGNTTEHRLKGLHPQTVYTLFLYSVSDMEISNASEAVTFQTLPDFTVKEQRFGNHSPIEIILIVSALLSWFIAIGMFVRKWQRIGGLQPTEKRYHDIPLSNITIVQCPQESIIYRNYGTKMSETMEKRQQRLNHIRRISTTSISPLNIKELTKKIKWKRKNNNNKHTPAKNKQNLENGKVPQLATFD